MEQSTKECFQRIKHVERVHLYIQTKTHMKVNGKMTKQMDLEHIFIGKVEQYIKVIGKMT